MGNSTANRKVKKKKKRRDGDAAVLEQGVPCSPRKGSQWAQILEKKSVKSREKMFLTGQSGKKG